MIPLDFLASLGEFLNVCHFAQQPKIKQKTEIIIIII